MSCTENESGPFVVFFLPAVVGCLTILLARRWANSQVTTSSTAVSRRRKIIKDPLIKRPLPPITCKMVAPGSKKSSGIHKKGNIPVEDDNGNGKRTGRTTRPGTVPVLSPFTSDVKPSNLSLPPKHIPIPYIPQDGELLFEVMSFMFTLVATGLQFLNLYRTAWWLPNSNTDQAMHFYLIDSHLVAFIVIFQSRRLLLSVTLVLLKLTVAPKVLTHASTASRMFVLGVLMGVLAWCLYFLANKHSIMKIFFLCYPSVIYFSLFGFTSGPFLEFNNPDAPLHSCSHDPDQIRAEVDLLREDINLKVKKIIFNSVVGAYYSSFIPCVFVQPTVYYSVYAASTQTVLALGAGAARDAQRHLGTAPAPRRAAAHLGTWVEVSGSAPAWCGSRLWARGARASAGGRVYEAASPQVAAEPGCPAHARFYLLFNNPSVLLSVILCLQLGLIVVQLCLLFSSIMWHYFVSIVILLFFNYYTLFKAARDYLIAWKVYKAEAMILEKNSPLHTN